MPRTTLPPTPASSSDIKGKDGNQHSALQMAFELPPPALNECAQDSRSAMSAARPSPATSPEATYPKQASETVKSRRRSSAVQGGGKDSFALPPPPTRSRKIIQMKPRAQGEPAEPNVSPKSTGPAKPGAAQAAGKKKPPSATSAAGRKIARKTAHSLIERRRRSKMNEEFAVLKDMIPACSGEMHKLAILQASIEYVRYLENCVAKLKVQQQTSVDATPTEMEMPTLSQASAYDRDGVYERHAEVQSSDVEMTGSEAPSPSIDAIPHRSNQSSISPVLVAEDYRHRQTSYSSASTDHRCYSYSAPSTTSPAFGPQSYGYAGANASTTASTLTSPALLPERDLDQEATAALLMLNSGRRAPPDTTQRSSGRGMSVRDLLST